ncbi:MAG: ABC transporter permease [Puniceicoccales bacterium]|nr:ABC transporter permease [Puniceicoccales bacterium]
MGASAECAVEVRPAGGGKRRRIVLAGDWKTGPVPSVGEILREWEGSLSAGTVAVEVSVNAWDSRLAAFLLRLRGALAEKGTFLDFSQLPGNLGQLLQLAEKGQTKAIPDLDGEQFRLAPAHSALRDQLIFIGELTLGIVQLLRKKSVPRGVGFGALFRQCGIESLPTVALISFLTGTILGFIGAVQLATFGAAIYVANLVAVAMAREMAPIMTGIVLTGRVGAAFSAALGSMRTGGEIDALTTLGLSPIAFLAVPRVLALGLMAPLLCVFSVFVGIAGGMAVVLPLFHLSATQYINKTFSAVGLSTFCFGIGKSAFFALLIAAIACRSGMACERSAAGVGRATTRAVVSGITALIVADAICALLADRLHI